MDRRGKSFFLFLVLGIFLAAVAFWGIKEGLFRSKAPVREKEGGEKYKYHIAMIAKNPSDIFWRTVYEGAREEGEKRGIYVENFGEGLSEDYSVPELFQMAAAARVDGILIEGEGGEELKGLVGEASRAGVPVITMSEDIAGSERKSFVSANDYALGELYGEQILEALDEFGGGKAAVLLRADKENTFPKLVYSGIHESVAQSGKEIELLAVTIGAKGEFEAEEKVRELFLNAEKRPNVVVCLSVEDTISAYQRAIDYNLVGQVRIIGYYTSPEILEGIEKGIIWSAAAVNAREMGGAAAKGMHEYLTEEYVSEYLSVSAALITRDNVKEYQREGGETKRGHGKGKT